MLKSAAPCAVPDWAAARPRIAPSVGPTHGVHAIANAGERRAAAAGGALGQPARTPLAGATRERGRGDEQQPHRDDHDAGDRLERLLVVEQQLAQEGGAEAEDDEDRRERRDEQQAAQHHPAPLGAGGGLPRCRAGDGGEVAGNQRQTARRDERHKAGRERQKDCWRLDHGSGGLV